MSNGPFGVPPPPPGGYGPPPGGYGGPPPGGYGAPPGGYGGPPGYGPPAGPPGYGPPGAPGAPGTNPYAAPNAPQAWQGPVGVVPGSGMKFLYLAGWIGYWLFAIGGGVATYLMASEGGGSSGGAQVASMLPMVGVVFLLVGMVGSMVWLYQAWNTVPPDMRYTDGGKQVTPGTAVGYCFIPFFNLYWIFIANVGLCSAINRTLQARGGQPRAPKGLATAACIAQVVPYCNILVGPILWTIYMFMLDGARKELVGRTA